MKKVFENLSFANKVHFGLVDNEPIIILSSKFGSQIGYIFGNPADLREMAAKMISFADNMEPKRLDL